MRQRFSIRDAWVAEVHLGMIASGDALSSKDIQKIYGRPDGRRGTGIRLYAANVTGWFETSKKDGHLLYRAIQKQPKPAVAKPPPPIKPPGPFDGVGRGARPWSSVWDYADRARAEA